MKKLIVSILFLLLAIAIWANVMPSHLVYISGLSFDGGKWEMEITTFQHDTTESPIDSILITSNSSRLVITEISTGQDLDQFLVMSDSVGTDFSINLEGDIVKVTGYFDGQETPPIVSQLMELKFGNVEGAEIGIPDNDEIIAGITYGFEKDTDFSRFVICKKDAGGVICKGTLTGKLFDHNGNVQKYGKFWLDDWFTLDENGNYTVEVLPYKHETNAIFYSEFENGGINFFNYVEITPVSFEITPDTLVNMDLYLQEKTYNSVVNKNPIEGIKVFPNPASSQIKLEISDVDLLSGKIKIMLFDVKGNLIMDIHLPSQKENCSIDVSTQKPGVYTLQIQQNNQVVSNQKIIVNPF